MTHFNFDRIYGKMNKSNKASAYITYILFVTFYAIGYLMRTSPGVVLPEVSKTLEMSPLFIGLVSGMFFYGYTLVQPLCGKLCDDREPVQIVITGMIIFAMGLLAFALAKGMFLLCFARFMIGIGAGPSYIALQVYQAKAFPGRLFSRLTAITILCGNIGCIVSVTPLGAAIDIFGYKYVHCIFALFIVAEAILLSFLIHSASYMQTLAAKNNRPQTSGRVFAGFNLIRHNRPLLSLIFIWPLVLVFKLNLIGLWGVSWFQVTGKLSIDVARNFVSCTTISYIIGAGMVVLTGERFVRASFFKSVYLAEIVSSIVLLAIICLHSPFWFGAVIMSLLGVVFGIIDVLNNVVVFKIVGSNSIGAATGSINVILFACVFLSQWLSGGFIEIWNRFMQNTILDSTSAFFAMIAAMQLIAFYPFYKAEYKL